ncbi:hypothetical protein GINT2_000042 [Glugoides intestinalis]
MPESRIVLRPLIDTKTGIFCHLLQINNTKIVIDCGITQDFDYSVYDAIREEIEGADCILLTSFDLRHIGAIGLFEKIQIFCTMPTAVLGKIFLDELHATLGGRAKNIFVPKQIKYSQPFKVNDVEITSFNAGYIIGNCMFKIVKDVETIVVGYNFNHRKENFLDGLLHSSIENANIFITNTAYISVPPHNLKNRDEKINELISTCTGTVIFSVSYQRLFELLYILSKHKLTIISKNGRMFVDRVKAMAEWTSSKTADLLTQLEIKFSKISALSDEKIVILVNEFYNEGYLGSVLQKFNREDCTLVLVDHEVTDIDFKTIKIYDYTYKQKQQAVDQVEAESMSDEEDEDGEEHWSKDKKVFFVHGILERKNYFQHIKRRRQNNEYGEPVKFKFEKKIEETELKAPKQQEVEEIEERTLLSTGIDPISKICSISLFGISDYISYKTVCESVNMNKIIIVEENESEARFLCSYFRACKLGIESYVSSNAVSFNTANIVQKIKVSEKVMELKFKRLADKSIVCFKAQVYEGVLDCVGPCSTVVVGLVNKEILRKSLIENGFQVETLDNVLVINNKLRIEFANNKLLVISQGVDLIVAIREILYKHILIL